MPDQPPSTHGNYPGTASNPIRAYRPNGRQCRRKADLDFLAFCVLEETTRMTADDLDDDDAERPRLPRAVMDRCSRPGPEPTTLEAVGNQWRYALVVVQAREGEEEEEEEECQYPIPRGIPSAGAQNTRGWEKLAIFDGNRRLSWKWCEIGPWLLWNVNRKSWVPD